MAVMSLMKSASSRSAMRVGRSSTVKVSAIFKTLAPKTVAPKPSKAETKTSGQQRFNKSTGLQAPLINGKEFPIKLGFTKTNELFVGRAAMLGFASALLGEVLTGQGILGQLGYELNVPTFEVDAFIGFLVVFNLVAAILPTSQTFEPEEQASLSSRPAGPLQDPKISLLEPQKFFGITSFGFSKENELFVGRVAQLGFASAIIGEVLTGKGPLAQFDFETGVSLADTEFGLLAFIAFFLLAAINEGTGKFVDDNEEVY